MKKVIVAMSGGVDSSLTAALLLEKNFKQFRVRIHGNLARIEILPNDFEKILPIREDIVKNFKNFGFDYVSLDLQGYRTGSMNIF